MNTLILNSILYFTSSQCIYFNRYDKDTDQRTLKTTFLYTIMYYRKISLIKKSGNSFSAGNCNGMTYVNNALQITVYDLLLVS